jgi:hypothetical protein
MTPQPIIIADKRFWRVLADGTMEQVTMRLGGGKGASFATTMAQKQWQEGK